MGGWKCVAEGRGLDKETFNLEVLEVSREERKGELWDVERKVGQELASQVPRQLSGRRSMRLRGRASSPARPCTLLPSQGRPRLQPLGKSGDEQSGDSGQQMAGVGSGPRGETH